MDHYYQGKKDFLDGKPMNVPAGGEAACDYRSGYRTAGTNVREHPEWTREFILQP